MRVNDTKRERERREREGKSDRERGSIHGYRVYCFEDTKNKRVQDNFKSQLVSIVEQIYKDRNTFDILGSICICFSEKDFEKTHK